jgi:hypothetical protein
MSAWRLPVLNAALPGAGLLIAGHLVAGLVTLIPAIVLLALILAVIGLFSWEAATPILGILGACYALLAAGAALWWWRCARRQRFDPTAVRLVHRTACAAFLQGRSAEALAGAQQLTGMAPEEAGTWRFLALVAGDAGDQRTARRAEARATAIDDR